MSLFCFRSVTRSRHWMVGCLVLSSVPLVRAQTQNPNHSLPTGIVAGAKVEQVWTGGTHTEGVAVASDGSVYFCDGTPTDMPGPLAAGHIYRFNPQSKQARIFRSPAGQANGMKFDHKGQMLVAEGADYGGRRITRTNLSNGKSEILAARYKDRPLNSPNDLTLDRQGRIYFTDPRYDGREPIEQPVQGVYRIDTDGSVHLIIADIAMPNGLAVSPDGNTLYLVQLDVKATDTRDLPPDVPRRREARILAYTLKNDGTVTGAPRVLVDYSPELGADGIALDSQGNIYAAVGAAGRRGIRIYSPEGREIGNIPVPENPTNVAFGRGADARTLYITAGGSLYRTQTSIPGLQLPPQ